MKSNIDISLLAASTLKTQVANIAPDPALLEVQTNLPPKAAQERAAKIAKQFGKRYQGILDKLLTRSIEAATGRVLDAEIEKLKGSILNMPASTLDDVQAEVLATYTTKKYFGASPAQRVTQIAQRVAKDVYTDTKALNHHRQPGEGAKRVVRKIKGHARGISAARTGTRFIVSEVNRAQAESILALGQNFGFKYYRWVTQQDAKVSKLDRARAQAVKHQLPAGIDPTGVYTAAEIKALPRHPFCRCGLEIVVTPIVPEESPEAVKSRAALEDATKLGKSMSYLQRLQEKFPYEPKKYEQSLFGVTTSKSFNADMAALDEKYRNSESPGRRAKLRQKRQQLIDESPDKVAALKRLTKSFRGKTVVVVDTRKQGKRLEKRAGYAYLEGKNFDEISLKVAAFNTRKAGVMIIDSDTIAAVPMVIASNLVHYVPPLTKAKQQSRSIRVGGKKNVITLYTNTHEDLLRAAAFERSTKKAGTKYQKNEGDDVTGYLTLVREENLKGKRTYMEVFTPSLKKIFGK